MSIVQDALKKAEKKQDEPGSNGRGGKGVWGVIVLIIFLALLGFTVKMIFGGYSRSNPGEGISIAQTIMKPVSSVSSSPGKVVGKKGTAAQFPGFVLSGIMQLVDGPRAIINDVIVGTGDFIGGVKVAKIEKDSVVLDSKGSNIILGME